MKPAFRPAVFSAESIHRAYLDCRRRKRSTPGAVAFEMRLADELVDFERELGTRTYRPRPGTRFVTRRPKLREIVAAQFRDRVVHHLFVRAVEPDWERAFIHDSFACRPGKGTHAAVDRLERFVQSVGIVPRLRDEVASRSIVKSPEGAEYVSPGRSPGSLEDREFKAPKGRNRKAPPDLLRPFRALACLPICSQGVALGSLMTPRWGLSFWTLVVCDSFLSSGTNALEADPSFMGQSREIEKKEAAR